jgi:hypothetical protein
MEKNQKFSRKIEELKNKIYSKKQKLAPKQRSEIHEKKHEISSSWKDDETEKIIKKPAKNLLGSSMFRKVFFGSLIFFVASALFGLFMFFGESNTVSGNNIDISILGNAFANGGEELPLQIQITNKNSVKLEYTDLLIEYQRGAGLGEDIYRERIGVGDIPAGDVIKQLLNVTLFGQQGTTRDIKITLEYRVPGSNAIFVKEKIYTVNISSAPVNLSVSGPENSGSNQNISFTIKTGLNTPEAVKNMMIVAEYPRGFDFKSATPPPTFGDNIWILGDLNPGVEKDVKVDGVIVAQSGEQRAFNVFVGQQKDVNERDMGVQFNSQSYVVSIQKPLLDTRITVNGNQAPEVTVTSGGSVKVDIDWNNSTNQKITDVEIVAELNGPIINYSSIKSNGFYESSTNKIIWNRQNLTGFASVNPGNKGTLSFSFNALPPTSGSEANIGISIKARDPNNTNEFLDIKNFDRKTLKIATNLQMVGHALYNSGAFPNTGPIPPTPGQPTTYSISWSLVNSLNDVSGAEVRGKLPIYVEYVGTKSPSGESLIYNQTTKEVVWNVGNIKKGTGGSLPAKEVQFQVRLNPSVSQMGETLDLVQSIKYKGLDVSTNTQINNSYQNIKTILNKDLNYNPQNDKVQ